MITPDVESRTRPALGEAGRAADAPRRARRSGVYKTNPHLQAAHRVHPFIVIWDDHEVVNDYAGEDASLLERRANAYRDPIVGGITSSRRSAIKNTAGVVTSAAVVMVAVFAIFCSPSSGTASSAAA